MPQEGLDAVKALLFGNAWFCRQLRKQTMKSNALRMVFEQRMFLSSPLGGRAGRPVVHAQRTNCILFPVVRKLQQNSCQPIENRMLFEWVQPGGFSGGGWLFVRAVAKVPNEF